MFFKRPFAIVLIISLAWHLFLIRSVSIVILPDNFLVNSYKPINFLGPLFKEIDLSSEAAKAAVIRTDLKSKIEAVTTNFHSEVKKDIVVKSKRPSQIPFNIKEEKITPDLLSLVELPKDNFKQEAKELPAETAIKYSAAGEGRLFLLNRPLTSPEPEDDVLNMRRLWQRHFSP